MHESVMTFVEGRVAAIVAERGGLEGLYILEVGSYDVNGSVRPLFDGCASYVGIDHEAGPGVDLMMDACDLLMADGIAERPSPDVVVSTEMLEHCLRPWKAIAEMHRVLAPGGVLLLTCRGFNESGSFPFHNPPDHFRYSADALAAMAIDAGFVLSVVDADPQVPGWFMVAVKN